MKQEKPNYNTSAEVKLISWDWLPRRRVYLIALSKYNDTAYLDYFYPGARPRFYSGMKIAVQFDSSKWKKNVWINSKIIINK